MYECACACVCVYITFFFYIKRFWWIALNPFRHSLTLSLTHTYTHTQICVPFYMYVYLFSHFHIGSTSFMNIIISNNNQVKWNFLFYSPSIVFTKSLTNEWTNWNYYAGHHKIKQFDCVSVCMLYTHCITLLKLITMTNKTQLCSFIFTSFIPLLFLPLDSARVKKEINVFRSFSCFLFLLLRRLFSINNLIGLL